MSNNRKKVKIINILHHPPAYNLYINEARPKISWDTPDGQWVGIWGYDWPDILGNEILKASTEFDYEVWQPDLRADKVYSHKFDNNLVHKLFPTQYKYHFYGLKIKRGFFSDSICNELEKEIKRSNKVLLLLNAWYSYFTEYILSKFHNKLPIINQFYVDFSKIFAQKTSSNVFKNIHRTLIQKRLKRFYLMMSNITVCREEGIERLKRNLKSNVYFLPWGFDFNEWSIDKEKEESRKLLNIPLNKYIILSSSRLTPSKQIDKLIEVLSKISNSNFICYITGHGTEEYERKLKKLVEFHKMEDKIIFTGYVDIEALKNYYLASDLFIVTSESEGGPMSVEYALALEVPVMMTDTGLGSEILKKYNSGCILPIHNYNIWKEKIEMAISRKPIKRIKRQLVSNLLNWNVIITNYIEIFRRVIRNYYGN